MICARCKKDTNTYRMSYFNVDEICLDCIDIEQKHPMYEEAKRVENEEVIKEYNRFANGEKESPEYNFKGIGLPDDFDEHVRKIKNSSK